MSMESHIQRGLWAALIASLLAVSVAFFGHGLRRRF